MWNKILAMLDIQLGFQSNKASSMVKKLWQGYDNQTNENVIWLEYRVRVRSTIAIWYSNRPNGIAASSNRKGTVGYE
jgi:hypothetical protein